MKDFIVYSEHFKAGVYPPLTRDVNDELNFRVKKGEHTDFEFMLKFENLGSHGALRLEIFDDAFKAFTQCPELFRVLASYHQDVHAKKDLPEDILEKIAKDLEKIGWTRKVPSPEAIKRCIPVCPTCGHEGKK